MKKGITYALLAAFISGISIFYNKLVVVKGIDSTIFNIIKNGGVAIIISTLIISSSSRKVFLAGLSKNFILLLAVGLIGGSIPFVLFFDGLKIVPAISASLIQKTLFLWVALLAVLILKEKISPIQILGYLLIFASNFLIGGFKGFEANYGELMILFATIFWSVENIIAKIALGKIDFKLVIWGRMFLGVTLLIGYAALTNKLGLLSKLTPNQFLPILGSIALLTGYVLSWYKALSLAPATVVTAILILATPITNLLTAVFVTRTFNVIQGVNLILSIVGILIITLVTKYNSQYGHPRINTLQ